MKNYAAYQADDFIQDPDFIDWVRGRSHREAFWLTFPETYPDTKEAFQQAEQFIRAAAVAPEPIGEAEIRREVEQFIERAGSYRPGRPAAGKVAPENAPRRFPVFQRVAVAAAVAAVLSVGWYFFRQRPAPFLSSPVESSGTQLVETTNATQHLLRVVLNDSSEVMLSPKSRLRYPSQFAGTTRVVYLTGEATFSVKRRKQPFLVYTGEMITRVLGTRFVVRAFDLDRKITVQVLSGKVSVYKSKSVSTAANKEVSGLILHANQAAIFEKSDGNLTKTLVTNPALVGEAPEVSEFNYEEVPLAEILQELEKSYGIPIQFDEQNFEGCRITAVLANETLYEKLDLLCKAASATYEITDGQIVISRKAYK